MKFRIGVFLIILPLLVGGAFIQPIASDSITQNVDSANEVITTSSPLEVESDDVLMSYNLASAPSEVSGTGAPLTGYEFGVRTDALVDETMLYDSGVGSTTTINHSISMGDEWEGYEVSADFTSIAENRTWTTNAGYTGAITGWSFGRNGTSGSSIPLYNFVTDGHGAGDDSVHFQIDSTSAGPTFWYNAFDAAWIEQTITIPRGEAIWAGIRMDYWADTGDDNNNHYKMSGPFSIFVEIEGIKAWELVFDDIEDEATWYDSGMIPISTLPFTNMPLDQDITFRIGLLSKQSVGFEPDIDPHAMIDNVFLYVMASATPESVNLEMNGIQVTNVTIGPTVQYGLGTVTYTPQVPWTSGVGYTNFSWAPIIVPPSPDLDFNLGIDVDISLHARRLGVDSISDTELYTTGDQYTCTNNSDVRWETNYYVAVPGGYSSQYFFNMTIPSNRDIDFLAEPSYRYINLTSGWNQGNPGDGVVNVSVYDITQTGQNGFWSIKGSSLNMITDLMIWDGLQWTGSNTFRAGADVRFLTTLPASYSSDTVQFNLYSPSGAVWTTLQAVVNSTGYAETSSVNLGASNASVGAWEVQAFVTDETSGGVIHNVGFYTRSFSIEHGTDMALRYPLGAESTWEYNATHGDLVLLQFRVNDTDNGDLLPAGTMTYTWDAGSGSVSDLGTGEYSVTLDTGELSTCGQYTVSLDWTKNHYDPLAKVFTINVIFTTDLFSADAPGVDIPRGYDAQLELYFEDQLAQPITGASIVCNWTLDTYDITPGAPGYYNLRIETDGVPLDNYAVQINASKDYHETRTIILSVQVRELHTSAIPSTSLLSLPVGYSTSFTITYTDTDHDLPISGAESSISCNWSAIHVSGDQNYTVAETATPGVYEVVLYSKDLDTLGTYAVVFNVETYGAQNHTFTVTVELRTHLTSFYLVNPIDPTPYTADVQFYVVYYDVDTDTGIIGSDVLIYVESTGLPSIIFTVSNSTTQGEYLVEIPAFQWGSIGPKNLTVFANWTGDTTKYSNETISTSVTVTVTPTDIFIGESPVMTAYRENVTFTVIYYDVGNTTGIVNATGPYAGNVHVTIEVITLGETLQQNQLVISEIDFINNPGEYRIEFNTSLLSGLVSCDLRIWFNWTKGVLPFYDNQTLQVTVHSIYRQAIVDWSPLPVTPYDELVNLSLSYIDVISGQPILNSSQLNITIQESISYTVYYDGDVTGLFLIEIDTSSWTPGNHTFSIDVVWTGSPFYQNRTGVVVPITVRNRYTDLTHGSYSSVQYGSNITIVFTYRDLDDYTSSGMNSGTLTLNASLAGNYDVQDNGDGTYTLELKTDNFGTLGTYTIQVSIVYGGSRFCENAADLFYLTLIERKTQLTSDLPDLAPYLSLANITVHYNDDETGIGIDSASLFASCWNSSQTLELDTNYWVFPQGSGSYIIRVSTVALGNFGTYTITITANWTGEPFYRERLRGVDIEVSRRPVTMSITKSPLNTPFLANVSFEFSAADGLDGSPIVLDKSVLILSHGSGTILANSEYSLAAIGGGLYSVAINSTVLTASLVSAYQIQVKMFWGDVPPYYANATTSTEVSVTGRYTQATVLSTPPAFYYFNITAVIEYGDYLSGDGIEGAFISVRCKNDSSIVSGFRDLGLGSYEVSINTTSLPGLGKYVFLLNVSWSGQPYYRNITDITFEVMVNPVSTTLSFDIAQTTTYYLGDTIIANVTYFAIIGDVGIEDATITTNLGDYGVTPIITQIEPGVYRIEINTSGLDAQLYSFTINASKLLHLNRSITADILVAAIPVDVGLVVDPPNPTWGVDLELLVNVTDARNGNPVIGASVNVTIESVLYLTIEISNGIYGINVSTTDFDSGEVTIRINSALINHESRERDFQLRIDRIATSMTATLDSQIAVNEQTIVLEVDYLISSNSSPIPVGFVTYSWIGGTGSIDWNSTQSKYIGNILILGVPVGTHQILVQASSANYKSVNIQATIEIRESTAEIQAFNSTIVLSGIYGDNVNVTVYLNNTDLIRPIPGALVTYYLGNFTGNMTDLGSGFYSVIVPTQGLEIRNHILTVTSLADGYTPSSIQFTISLDKVPTQIDIIGEAFIEEFYGRNITFTLQFIDSHNDIGIENATGTYILGSLQGELTHIVNGTYTLELDTAVVSPSSIAYDITIAFLKDSYDYAYSLVRLRVKPISTQVIMDFEDARFPINDNYTMLFHLNDTLNGGMIVGADATALWTFGTTRLSDLGNGSYAFGSYQTQRPILENGTYLLRISFTKQNFATSEILLTLRINKIATSIEFEAPPAMIDRGQMFLVKLTFWDSDHSMPISGAINSTPGLTLVRLYENEINYGNGTYVFAFSATDIARHELVIRLSRDDYEDSSVLIIVFSKPSDQELALYSAFQYGALALFGLIAVAALYIKVLSVPQVIRRIRKMEKSLRKGVIPAPAPVPDRRGALYQFMVEDLKPLEITKSIEDISPSSLDVTVLDTDELLQELAIVIGLTSDDVATLKMDLDKMRPSERAGFIAEVLRQERSRRARELAEVRAEELPEEEVDRPPTEQEIAEFRMRLIRLGISPDEVEIMVEQARNLTKAEIDALLSQLGGMS